MLLVISTFFLLFGKKDFSYPLSYYWFSSINPISKYFDLGTFQVQYS